MSKLEKATEYLKEKLEGKDVDETTFEYIVSYFENPSADEQTEDALKDFAGPLLADYIEEDEIDTICKELSELVFDKKKKNTDLKILNAPVQMNANTISTNDIFSTKVSDIRWLNSNRGPNAIDEKKLKEQEKQMKKKLAKREQRLLEKDLPVYDPSKPPEIIVNQMPVNFTDQKTKDLIIENFDIHYGSKCILMNADLSLSFGRRYGLIGKNGIGKSTLLRAIAWRELKYPEHLTVFNVEQEIQGDDTPAIQSVLECDKVRTELIKEEKEILHKLESKSDDESKLAVRLKEIYQKLEEIESETAETRASTILSGLGFSQDEQKLPTKSFSGGWRMRLSLAQALFSRPNILLLDEPTNMLDFPAVVWLENYINTQLKSTLLVVSHDRAFLDNVTTDIIHLHNYTLEAYRGNFSTFSATKNERRRNQIREYEAQLQYRQHLQAFIDRWRYNAKRAPQAQSKLKILEKLPPLEPPPKDEMEGLGESERMVYFKFGEPERVTPPIMQMEDVSFGYTPEKIVLEHVDFDLQMDSKIAVVGPNGSGKTTLINLLLGHNQPNSGIVRSNGRLKIGHFNQFHVDQLDLNMTCVQLLASKFPGQTEEEYRRQLGRFGITGQTGLQVIGTLSGGQKSRVVFTMIAMSHPHVLVFDEPTNHLDMDTIDALTLSLKDFKGGVLVVSHDEKFLDAVCNEVWVCSNKRLTRFTGKENSNEGIVKQYKESLNIEYI